jgi:glycosyltransferase involved in cell wall biosynthesis
VTNPTQLPDVSVIVATYNRSAVLRCVLEVLRWQTFQNWEALIVGDACSDDTDAVVAAFDEPRFRFLNLSRNHGEQSAANNAGLRLARGRILAFLNHDDFWRPDHLERGLECLHQSNSDLVYSWIANLLPDDTVVLLGVSPHGTYSPDVVVPASAWMLRRELVDRVGQWRNGWTIRLSPSQDWLWRAARLDARITEIPRVSVLGLPSGARPGSYSVGDDAEHVRWRDRIAADSLWPETLLARYVHAQTQGGRVPTSARPIGQLSWFVKNLAASGMARLGLHPFALLHAVRHPGRGGFLRMLRKTRGLSPREEV